MVSVMLLVISTACFGAASYDPSSDIDQVWLEKYKLEGRSAYERYRAVKEIEETVERRFEKAPGNENRKFRNLTIKINTIQFGRNRLFQLNRVFDDQPGNPVIQIDGVNDQYRFTLSRPGAVGPYTLLNYAALRPNERRDEAGDYAAAWNSIGIALRAADNEQGYNLKALRWDAELKLLYVGFSRNDGSKDKPIRRDEEAWFDPANNWRIVKTTNRTSKSYSVTTRTYGQEIDGLSFPTEVNVTNTPQGNSDEAPSHIRVTLKLSKPTKNLGIFRISAYGLPEPDEFKGTAVGMWTIAGIVGAVLSISLMYFLRRMRRRKAR